MASRRNSLEVTPDGAECRSDELLASRSRDAVVDDRIQKSSASDGALAMPKAGMTISFPFINYTMFPHRAFKYKMTDIGRNMGNLGQVTRAMTGLFMHPNCWLEGFWGLGCSTQVVRSVYLNRWTKRRSKK